MQEYRIAVNSNYRTLGETELILKDFGGLYRLFGEEIFYKMRDIVLDFYLILKKKTVVIKNASAGGLVYWCCVDLPLHLSQTYIAQHFNCTEMTLRNRIAEIKSCSPSDIRQQLQAVLQSIPIKPKPPKRPKTDLLPPDTSKICQCLELVYTHKVHPKTSKIKKLHPLKIIHPYEYRPIIASLHKYESKSFAVDLVKSLLKLDAEDLVILLLAKLIKCGFFCEEIYRTLVPLLGSTNLVIVQATLHYLRRQNPTLDNQNIYEVSQTFSYKMVRSILRYIGQKSERKDANSQYGAFLRSLISI